MKLPKKILICGLGSMGYKYYQIISKTWPDIKLSFLITIIGTRKQHIPSTIPIHTSLVSALKWQPDIALVATPASNHLELALSLTKKSIPVLVEKPVGIDSGDSPLWDELLENSKKTPVLVGYIFRHDPSVNWIVNHIKNLSLGKLIDADFYCGSWLPNWRKEINYKQSVSANSFLGGGALLELSHEIDLAIYLFGPLKLSYSSIKNSNILDIDVEDNVIMVFESLENSTITTRLNFCTTPSKRLLSIRGTQGEISWDMINSYSKFVDSDNLIQSTYKGPKLSELYQKQLEHMFLCSAGEVNPKSTLTDGLKVLSLISEIKSRN